MAKKKLKQRRKKSSKKQERKKTNGAWWVFATIVVVGSFFVFQPRPEPRKTAAPRQTPVMRVATPKTIALGQVEFAPVGKTTNEERGRLFASMKRAYSKLVSYFGKEAMTFPRSVKIPLRTNRVARDYAEGQVVWTNQLIWRQGMVPEISSEKPKSLYLPTTEEKTIAHEFVHLYLQNSGVWSTAYYEGLAEAVDEKLYPSASQSLAVDDQIRIPSMAKTMNVQWDVNKTDSAMKGGLPMPLMLLVRARWQDDWLKLEERNPGFLKRFFQKMHQAKRSGTIYFSKSRLDQIASQSAKGFAEWVNGAGVSTRDIRNRPDLISAHRLGENVMGFFNLRFSPRVVRGSQYWPATVVVAENGRIQLMSRDGRGSVGARQSKAPFFMMRMPANIYHSQFRFLVNGQEFPAHR